MIGPYDELMTKHEELFKYLVYENNFVRSKSIESGAESTAQRKPRSRHTSRQLSNQSGQFGSLEEEKFLQDQFEFAQSKHSIHEQLDKISDKKEPDDEEEDDDLYAEKRFKGSNSFKMYILYLKTGYGYFGFTLFFVLFIVSQFLQTYTEYLLATW